MSKILKKNKLHIFFFIGIAGLASISTALYLRYQKRVLSFTKDLPEAIQSQETTQNEYYNPSKIKFAKLNLEIPVVSSEIKNGVWEISDNSASFLSTSKKPGQGGNIVIYGHNKRIIFGPLIGRVKKDDTIEVATEEGKIFSYKVFEVFEVTPEEAEILM